MGGQPLNFVCPETWIKWILLENLPGLADGFLESNEGDKNHARTAQRPDSDSSSKGGGGVSKSAFSISTNRPASTSLMASLKSSGIHESSSCTTNRATFARSDAGRALI